MVYLIYMFDLVKYLNSYELPKFDLNEEFCKN